MRVYELFLNCELINANCVYDNCLCNLQFRTANFNSTDRSHVVYRGSVTDVTRTGHGHVTDVTLDRTRRHARTRCNDDAGRTTDGSRTVKGWFKNSRGYMTDDGRQTDGRGR